MARLLVIEDQAAVRETVCMVLKNAGHSVIEAEDGDEGLARLATEMVDLVLTDIIMPRTEGIGAIREIKRLYPAMKIIAMSGTGAYALYLHSAQKLGADAVLAKPFKQHELREAVGRVLAASATT